MPESFLHTEKELLFRVADGDEIAFRAIYDRYKCSFHATAYKMVRSGDIAEDIVQEVFVTLWKKRNLLATAPNPVGYLMTMLHNAIFYHFRRVERERRLKAHLTLEAESGDSSPVEEWLLAREHQGALEVLISQLTPQQQMVYRLSRQNGLSREEIAQQLGISPNTVRNHLNVALGCIKDHFQKGASAVIWAFVWSHL